MHNKSTDAISPEGLQQSAARGVTEPIPRPRDRRRAARTTEILSLALQQIENRGLDGLTLQSIADKLDYTVAALYRYFPSKDALIGELQRRVVAVLDRKLAETEEQCREAIPSLAPKQRETTGPLVPIAAAGVFYSGLAHSAPEAFGLLAISLGDPRRLIDDAHARAVVDTARPMLARIAEHAERAVEAGALASGNASDRAVMLWGAVHGVAQLGKLSRLDPQMLAPERLCTTLVQSLLVGWGARPESAEHAITLVREARLGDPSVGPEELAAVAVP
jgi:AcrR family transcriptional regulator